MSKPQQVLVDGFYAAYRSFFAFEGIRTKDGRSSGLIFGFIKTLLSLKKRFPCAELVVCWDSPSTWRKALYAPYKGTRSKTARFDTRQIYAAADFVRAVGVKQALAKGHEADDVIGSLVDQEMHNIIFSRDRDFCQLVCDGVTEVYSPKSGENPETVYTESVVLDKFGVSPNRLLHYRMLRGDSSDNLPGLPRFPSKKILELVNTHDTVDEILDSPRVTLTEHQKTALTDFRPQALLNLQLMRILQDLDVKVIEGNYNRQRAETLLGEFELHSLRTSISLFLDQGEEQLSFFA